MSSDPRWARLIMELRHAGVSDTRVLSAMERIPRQRFVAIDTIEEAFDNRALPIACGQTISQPLIVGLMTQALELDDRCKVLEIGTGSGYQAAVLSRLCRRLYSLERHRDLHTSAENLFSELGLRNITTRLGDGWKGWPEQAPFDRIIVTAAAPEIPMALAEQLGIGGIMVIPVGPEYETQSLIRLRRDESGFTAETLFDVRFVPMVHGLAVGKPA